MLEALKVIILGIVQESRVAPDQQYRASDPGGRTD